MGRTEIRIKLGELSTFWQKQKPGIRFASYWAEQESKLNRNVGEPSRLLRPNEELNKNTNLTVITVKTR